ncbi:hypothetical protein [Lentibacter algarum]|uniref:hypothetical protein n=1 Tax=Lentibacter algarum TaxID=576131 RepID=UPI00339D46D0
MMLSRTLIYSIVLVTIGYFVAILTSNSFSFLTLRALYQFISFFIFFAATNSIIQRRYDIQPLVKIFNFIWIVAGVVELRFPMFLDIFGKVRTGTGRGVTSFAPEPSFFVAFLIFSSALLLVLDGYSFKKSKWVHLLNVIALLLLAKSAIGMAYLSVIIICYFGYLILRLRPKKLGLYIIFGVAALAAFIPVLLTMSQTDTRALNLILKLATEGPLLLIKIDASINERAAHVILPIHAAIQNFFLPLGFDTFSETRLEIQSFYNGFFWQDMNTDKIMSWMGDWIYTLGIFGILGLVLIFVNFPKLPREGKWTLTAVSIILFSAIPVSFPLVGILFAYISSGLNEN